MIADDSYGMRRPHSNGNSFPLMFIMHVGSGQGHSRVFLLLFVGLYNKASS